MRCGQQDKKGTPTPPPRRWQYSFLNVNMLSLLSVIYPARRLLKTNHAHRPASSQAFPFLLTFPPLAAVVRKRELVVGLAGVH